MTLPSSAATFYDYKCIQLTSTSARPKVSSFKVVLGSQKCFGISKNALGSQNVLDKIVDIDDTVTLLT